jgi:hypothetical protein
MVFGSHGKVVALLAARMKMAFALGRETFKKA